MLTIGWKDFLKPSELLLKKMVRVKKKSWNFRTFVKLGLTPSPLWWLRHKQDILIFKVKLCREKERKGEGKYQLTKSDWLSDKVCHLWVLKRFAVVWCSVVWKVIIVSALSLSEKERRERERELDRNYDVKNLLMIV